MTKLNFNRSTPIYAIRANDAKRPEYRAAILAAAEKASPVVRRSLLALVA